MTTAWHVTNGLQQFCDANGKPLANGTVGFYTPGTLNLKTIWQDNAKVTPYANPLTLNASGEPQSGPAFGDGQYRQIVKDSLGVTIWDQNTESSQSTIAQSDITAALGFTPASASGGNLTGPLNAPSVTLASAATMNIGAAAGEYIIVTGAIGITAFDTVQAGTVRRLKFSGAPLITCNTTSLIINGLANAQTFQVTAGDVLTFVSEGGGNWRLTGKTSSVEYVLLGFQKFTASGTYTRSPGVAAGLIQAVGAGGGAGGCTSASAQAGVASAGGGGQFAQLWKVGIATALAVTIGAHGVGATSAADGTAGTSTTVGAILTAHGGAAGTHLASSGGGTVLAGGAGGTGASSGDFAIDGQAGGQGYRIPSGGTPNYGGDGGSSGLNYGQGGRGASFGVVNTQTSGSPGTGFGGGGGAGQANGTGGATANGGDGTDGFVIIWEYAAV